MKIVDRKITRTRVLLILLVIALAVFGYSLYTKRHLERQRTEALERLQQQHAGVQDLLSRWSDAVRLATMTSRIALSEPLGRMQVIKREMESTRNNKCFDKVTRDIADSMGNGLFAFEMFIKYPSNSSASDATSKYLDKSTEGIAAGSEQIKMCMTEAVNNINAQ